MATDFGRPVDPVCKELPGKPGVFERKYTTMTVQLDCNTFEAAFTPVGSTAAARQQRAQQAPPGAAAGGGGYGGRGKNVVH